FREDLFYRLNVFPIEMPALRERVDDLAMLVQTIAGQLARTGRSRRLRTESRPSPALAEALMPIPVTSPLLPPLEEFLPYLERI
ncbi:hypothetical protein QT822_22440, partial [Xanthomonas citri pv. citri]